MAGGRLNGAGPVGPRIAAAKRHLLARAAALGGTTVRDPAIRILVDDHAAAAQTEGPHRRVSLPGRAVALRLRSRTRCPAHMRPDETDTHRLGIAASRVRLDRREARLASAVLVRGWHAPEPGWRWTDGDAERLLSSGGREVTFEITITGIYWYRAQHAPARPVRGRTRRA